MKWMEILDLAKIEQLKTLNLSCNADHSISINCNITYIQFWSDLVTVHYLCYIICSISPFDFAFVNAAVADRAQHNATKETHANRQNAIILRKHPHRFDTHNIANKKESKLHRVLSTCMFVRDIKKWWTRGAGLFVPLKAIWVSFLSMLLEK